MRQSLVAVAFALCATPSSSFSVGSLRAPFAPQSSSSSSSPALVPARFGAVFMQEEGGGGGADGGERERSRGRTAVVSRPKPKPKQDRKEQVDKENSWRVLLHNDDVRTGTAELICLHPSIYHSACCRFFLCSRNVFISFAHPRAYAAPLSGAHL